MPELDLQAEARKLIGWQGPKKQARQRRLEIVLAWKANGCSMCPEKRPICLEAHHIDHSAPRGKTIAQLMNSSKPGELEAELRKCIPLCANCHRYLHSVLPRKRTGKLSIEEKEWQEWKRAIEAERNYD